jgi:hypothetical protein
MGQHQSRQEADLCDGAHAACWWAQARRAHDQRCHALHQSSLQSDFWACDPICISDNPSQIGHPLNESGFRGQPFTQKPPTKRVPRWGFLRSDSWPEGHAMLALSGEVGVW